MCSVVLLPLTTRNVLQGREPCNIGFISVERVCRPPMHAVVNPLQVQAMSLPTPDFPTELVVRVLQFVPLPQRLQGCAIVCKAWAAAAVAATHNVSFSSNWCPSEADFNESHARGCRLGPGNWRVPAGLEAWLQQFGTGVERLDVCFTYQSKYGYGCYAALHLPYAKLQQLTSLSQQGITLQPTLAPQPKQQGNASNRTLSPSQASSSSVDNSPMVPQRSRSLMMRRMPSRSRSHERRRSQSSSSQSSRSCSCSRSRSPSRSRSRSNSPSSRLGRHMSSSSSWVSALPNLVELKLVKCSIGSKAEFLQLVSTPGLTSLHLEDLSWAAGAGGRSGRGVPLYTVVPALEQCSKLVILRLNLPNGMTDLSTTPHSPLASISRLQRLQHLAIDLPYDAPKHFLPEVPAGLTHLELKSGGSRQENIRLCCCSRSPSCSICSP